MYGIFFKAKAKRERREELLKFLKRDGEYAKENEEGTLRFEFYQDPDDDCLFYVYEAYRDENAKNAHMDGDPYNEWKAMKVEWLEWLGKDKPEVDIVKGVAVWAGIRVDDSSDDCTDK